MKTENNLDELMRMQARRVRELREHESGFRSTSPAANLLVINLLKAEITDLDTAIQWELFGPTEGMA